MLHIFIILFFRKKAYLLFSFYFSRPPHTQQKQKTLCIKNQKVTLFMPKSFEDNLRTFLSLTGCAVVEFLFCCCVFLLRRFFFPPRCVITIIIIFLLSFSFSCSLLLYLYIYCFCNYERYTYKEYWG